MSHQVTVKSIRGSGANVDVEFPDECPVCHRNVAPIFVEGSMTLESLRAEIQIVFRCTNHKCDNLFIGIYRQNHDGSYYLNDSEPKHPVDKIFEESIQKVSPSFISIYNQAIAAESFNLDQIVGIGLRKAFEFLIKDFAINQSPDKSSEIKASTLGEVIKVYIKDETLKAVADRAAWLGNDETHYERLWLDKDIEDLKALIHLSLNWIDNVIKSAVYINGMEPKKRKAE